MPMLRFSFVLPAYKGRYLRESINSILAQECKDFELIIVDDCSPDGLEAIVAEYDDARITYHRNEENIGGRDLVAQWNNCLGYAQGEYVILATDDDLYESNFLSSFVPLMEKYPAVDLFRARVLSVNSKNDIMWIDKCFKEYLSPIEFRYHMMHGMRGGIPQYIFKRDELVKHGGFVNFPLAWGADDATAMMMSTNDVVTSQEHLVRFRWSDINISSERKHTGLEKLKARLMQIKWMKEHPAALENMSAEWTDFYQRDVIDFQRIFAKQLLMQRLAGMPFSQWLPAYRMIRNSHLFSGKEIYSIFYREFF